MLQAYHYSYVVIRINILAAVFQYEAAQRDFAREMSSYMYDTISASTAAGYFLAAAWPLRSFDERQRASRQILADWPSAHYAERARTMPARAAGLSAGHQVREAAALPLNERFSIRARRASASYRPTPHRFMLRAAEYRARSAMCDARRRCATPPQKPAVMTPGPAYGQEIIHIGR